MTFTTGKWQVLKVLATGAVGKKGLRAREENEALLELAAAEAVRRLQTAEAGEKSAQGDGKIREQTEKDREVMLWQCIREAWGSDPDPALLRGCSVRLGSAEDLRAAAIPIIPAREVGEILYLAVDGAFRGYLVIGDPVRTEAAETVEELRAAGIREIALLAGEDQKGAEAFAGKEGIDEVLSESAEGIRGVLKEWKQRCGGTIGMAGGREELAAAGSEAAVTIAIGRKGGGSRQAVRAADAVLRTGDLRGTGLIVAEGKHAVSIVRRISLGAVILETAILVLRFVRVV